MAPADPEAQPLLRSTPATYAVFFPQLNFVFNILPTLFCGLGMISASAALIFSNKYLLNADRFPFPVFLVLLHFVAASSMSGIVYIFQPKWFPSLSQRDSQVILTPSFVFTRIAPVACLIVMSVVLGNTAYMYCSVAFLQMLKESNVVTIYILSTIAGLERLQTFEALIVLGIVASTCCTVSGELNFSLIGTLIQIACCLCESSKTVLQSILLGGSCKMDPLAYLLAVMPVCALMTGFILFLDFSVIDIPGVHLPTEKHIIKHGWLLFGNVCLALLLNVFAAAFINYTSAMAFVLTNIFKDTAIVLGGAVVLGEVISRKQCYAFASQLFFIGLWSFRKADEATRTKLVDGKRTI